MGYYLLLYYKGKNRQKVKCPEWEEWDQEISNALVEGANTCPDACLVTQDNASKVNEQDVAGYRVIKASDLGEAAEISKSAPPMWSGGRAEIFQVQAPAL